MTDTTSNGSATTASRAEPFGPAGTRTFGSVSAWATALSASLLVFGDLIALDVAVSWALSGLLDLPIIIAGLAGGIVAITSLWLCWRLFRAALRAERGMAGRGAVP